jgi:hypothetical protein
MKESAGKSLLEVSAPIIRPSRLLLASRNNLHEDRSHLETRQAALSLPVPLREVLRLPLFLFSRYAQMGSAPNRSWSLGRRLQRISEYELRQAIRENRLPFPRPAA